MIQMAVKDLPVVVGEDFSTKFYVVIDDVRLNFDGAEIYSSVRKRPNREATKIADFVVTTEQILPEFEGDLPEYTKIILSLPAEVTSLINDSKGYYDVLVVLNGKRKYYLKGEITFEDTSSEEAV